MLTSTLQRVESIDDSACCSGYRKNAPTRISPIPVPRLEPQRLLTPQSFGDSPRHYPKFAIRLTAN